MNDLGSSDVAYEGKLFKKSEKFNTTLYEWLWINGEEYYQYVDSPQYFQVLPENKILFITSAFITANTNGAGARNELLAFDLNDLNTTTFLTLGVDGTSVNSDAISITYAHPIIIRGNSFRLGLESTSSDITGTCGFQGFIIDKAVFDNIFKD